MLSKTQANINNRKRLASLSGDHGPAVDTAHMAKHNMTVSLNIETKDQGECPLPGVDVGGGDLL